MSIVKCTFKHIQGTICLTYSQGWSCPRQTITIATTYNAIYSFLWCWYSTYPPPPPPPPYLSPYCCLLRNNLFGPEGKPQLVPSTFLIGIEGHVGIWHFAPLSVHTHTTLTQQQHWPEGCKERGGGCNVKYLIRWDETNADPFTKIQHTQFKRRRSLSLLPFRVICSAARKVTLLASGLRPSPTRKPRRPCGRQEVAIKGEIQLQIPLANSRLPVLPCLEFRNWIYLMAHKGRRMFHRCRSSSSVLQPERSSS